MRVTRWGDGLAVRLPDDVVDALGLKPGDEVRVTAQPSGDVAIAREDRRDAFAARLAAWQPVGLPADWHFDRDEAHER